MNEGLFVPGKRHKKAGSPRMKSYMSTVSYSLFLVSKHIFV